MEQQNPASGRLISVPNYSIGVGLDERRNPVCVFLHRQSLPDGDLAMQATHGVLHLDELQLVAPGGTMVLMSLSPVVREAVEQGYPVMVLDPMSRDEHVISVRLG